jgi:diguanylate cyclase (GGDEF)-like protein
MHDDVITEVNLVPVAVEVPQRTQASLVVLAGDESPGRIFRLEGGARYTVGRSSEADVRLDGLGISRLHARVHCLEGGAVEVEDLGSRNGTWVGGERVRRRRLADGERVQVGPSTVLKLTYQDPLELAFHESLYASATRDALTGCFNQRYFHEALSRELAFSSRRGQPLSVVLLDVDLFKQVNDAHGHPVGDEVLAGLGALLREVARQEDVVARVGGEEFALLVRDCAPPFALALAERVCRRVRETPVQTRCGRTLRVSVSVGVASHEPGHAAPDALLAAADRALYAAKARGRDQVASAPRAAVA